jgi:hypothetical protein
MGLEIDGKILRIRSISGDRGRSFDGVGENQAVPAGLSTFPNKLSENFNFYENPLWLQLWLEIADAKFDIGVVVLLRVAKCRAAYIARHGSSVDIEWLRASKPPARCHGRGPRRNRA